MNKQRTQIGVTLLEMLLVLAVISTVLVMILGYVTQKSAELRRDRVTLQMQQLLNAAMAYYVNNSSWPVQNGVCPTATQSGGSSSPMAILRYNNYVLPSLPAPEPKNPWGNVFGMNCNPTTGQFYVYTNANNSTDAAIVAGRLPLGMTANGGGVTNNPPYYCSGSADCTYVVAAVTVPGQNLNNARSVNFAGVYSAGACVPAPVCPTGMKPQIFVTPTGVSGVYDPGSTNVYPISSFTAFARGDASNNPTSPTGVYDCKVVNAPSVRACNSWPGNGNPAAGSDPAGTTYWRVCLAVVTEKGRVQFLQGPYGENDFNATTKIRQSGSIMAITRCAPNNETPTGSPFGYVEPTNAWLP